jgi:hypothetical protein
MHSLSVVELQTQGDEMQIMNGDHMQFEIDHANTPKEEQPDWPLPSFDARDWAKAFCKTVKDKQGVDLDEGWMVSWFAASLMRGYDEGRSRVSESRTNTGD